MNDRCPATTRHTPSLATFAVGVQCKYARGHDGEHAGHATFTEGDVFWPQEGLAVTSPRGTFLRKETGQ